VVSWALVEDGGRVTAVDAGLPTDWDDLVAGLGDLGRGLGDLEAVVLAHAHVDHMGWAERARREAGARVLVQEADMDNLRATSVAASERSPRRYLRYAATRELVATLLRARAYEAKPIRGAVAFRDGETLDVPGRRRVVHTPGHSSGSCSLHLPERGVLFAGDSFVVRDPYTGPSGRYIVARARRPTPPRRCARSIAWRTSRPKWSSPGTATPGATASARPRAAPRPPARRSRRHSRD
jgi:glyoxylase-like metal-dependent hydrolase (beta-lactamase superfamily II)